MENRITIIFGLFFLLFLATSSLFAVDRDTVIQIAKSYAEHKWTCTTANTRANCAPSYKSDYTPGTYTGVPYDWGGYKTISEFDNEIKNGYGAGSHSKDGVLSCTTGVDCSGYVSKCWQEARYTTSTISQISYSIDKKSVKKGDIFNKAGSHVVLFSHFDSSGKPIFYEASGSASKVRLNTTGGWSFLNGYVARRYKNIAENTQQNNCSSPIIIQSFPFQDSRNTEESTCKNFNFYSCAPSTNEKGSEYIYQFEVKSSGTLSVSVTCGTGVDIDVHLLSQLDANKCIIRNDKSFTAHIDPGKYYIVADSYVGSSGIVYDGPYTLNINFMPDNSMDAGYPDVITDTGIQNQKQTVKGVVYEDKGSGEQDMSIRLKGASVTVAETGEKTTTDSTSALFQFSLYPGVYTLKGELSGYETNNRRCEVLSGIENWCSIGLKKIQDEIITITSLPYTDSRDTRNSKHDSFNYYSCATTKGEKGPEYIYKVAFPSSGTVTVTVTDGTGVDIDIHLLKSLDPNSCITRADTTFSASVNQDTYYIIADTYSDSSGKEYPGPYTINVTFKGNSTKGELIGQMWNTYYYFPYEKDYTDTDDTTIYDADCKPIATVPQKYADTICIEGSGKLEDGRVVNYSKTCSCGKKCASYNYIVCYDVLDSNLYPWGMGSKGNPLVPLRSWAVDNSIIPFGTTIYAEEWDGVMIPDIDGLGNFIHDGCFKADDTGGAITGYHFDLFAGTSNMWKELEKIFPTKSNFHVYKNNPKCDYLK